MNGETERETEGGAGDEVRGGSLPVLEVLASHLKQMPRGNWNLADQLMRSSRTSCLAIAEGANSRSGRMKRVFFERAVSSNGESTACLDEVEDDGVAPLELIAQARGLLHRASRRISPNKVLRRAHR